MLAIPFMPATPVVLSFPVLSLDFAASCEGWVRVGVVCGAMEKMGKLVVRRSWSVILRACCWMCSTCRDCLLQRI